MPGKFGVKGRSMQQSDLALDATTSVQQSTVTTRAPFLAAGVFALGLAAVGTGGAAAGPAIADLARNMQSTNVTWQWVTAIRKSEEDQVLTPNQQVLAIQQTLSLTRSDLADVLKVSRPTVYKWLRNEAAPHTQNLVRIGNVFLAAKRWQLFSDERLRGHVRAPIIQGRSIVDMLASDTIDAKELDLAFASIHGAVIREHSSRRVSRVVKRIEFPPLSESEREDNLIGEAGI